MKPSGSFYLWAALLPILWNYKTEALCNNTRQHPKLFDTEDYYECPLSHSWCDVSLKLVPTDANSECWKFLEESSKHRTQFNKTMVFRTLCLPPLDKVELKNHIERRLNEELRFFNVSTSLIGKWCMEPRVKYDYNKDFYFTVAGLYLLLLAVATCYENFVGRSDTDSLTKQIFCCFSIYSQNTPQTRSVPRLLCMQGIRTMQTFIVIVGHIGMFLTQRNIENTDYLELIYSIVVQWCVSAGMASLQTFFVMSTWLLTYQILRLHKESGEFSFRHALLKIVNRYLRVWPAVIFTIFIALPVVSLFYYGPGTFPTASLTNQSCSKTWWMTLLMATNWLKTHEMCHLGMWSLSIDIQLQLLTIAFFYIVLNNKLSIKKGLLTMFIVSHMVNCALTYKYDVNVDSYIGVKYLARLTYFLSDGLLNSYLSFWPNVGSGIVGMLFGYLYFLSKAKEGDGKPEPYEQYYLTIFVVFPLMGIVGPLLLGDDKLITALVFPIFKPIFGFGIATGIYGMSRNVIQGVAKRCCENKFLTAIGDHTFGIYIIHFLFIFSKDSNMTTTYVAGILTLANEISQEFVKSVLGGILLTVTFIKPFYDLQRLVVPSAKPLAKTVYVNEVDKMKVQ